MPDDKIPTYDLLLHMPKTFTGAVFLKNGQQVFERDVVDHSKFGRGEIVMICSVETDEPLLYIQFSNEYGRKLIDPRHAELKIVADSD
ncbi:MAG: hypothetical protein MN733_00400 [Nitrososphaera sp.]|nr:hypothetical protein [Nitrososphaera sp.]